MYSDDEKAKLMDELKDMESLKVDTGSEGLMLQHDLIDYFTKSSGDRDDLAMRIELYFYAFKIFSRKPVRIDKNQFFIYLNDSILEFEKICLVMRDLDKFELVIQSDDESGEVLLNLNFTYHY